jgi:hypothetical protein
MRQGAKGLTWFEEGQGRDHAQAMLDNAMAFEDECVDQLRHVTHELSPFYRTP